MEFKLIGFITFIMVHSTCSSEVMMGLPVSGAKKTKCKTTSTIDMNVSHVLGSNVNFYCT